MTANLERRQIVKSHLLKDLYRNRVAYAYISPFYILFIIFGAFPLVAGFYLSLHNWDGLSDMIFIGFGNYINLFKDTVFLKAVYNTLFIGIIAHIPMLFGALILAFIINMGIIKGKDIFRTVYFLPVITGSVAVAIVFRMLYGVRAGLINYVLTLAHITPIDWWGGHGAWIKPAIIILFVWKWIGWNMVIYLAGMQGISNDYYEAARIDGANLPQMFFRITLPLLKPIIFFTLIQSTIGGLTIFAEPYMLLEGSSGGTNYEGLTLMVFLYRDAFEYVHFGYASAVAYVVSAFIIIISFFNMKFFGKENT
ncbi:MAG: sugar ABC transporter permease [Treponemataceae bacterium]